jgi:hypothetical protein
MARSRRRRSRLLPRLRSLGLLALACRASSSGDTPRDLGHELAGADVERAATWKLPRATWDRVVVAPFTGLYDEYAAAFDRALPTLVHPAGPPRPHFAGDPELTLDEAVTRWIVPTLFPSQVATGIDAVFFDDDGHWRAIVGMAAVLARHVDAPCTALVARVGPPGRCTEVAWQLVVDSLRGDREAARHTCQLATTLCGIRSP